VVLMLNALAGRSSDAYVLRGMMMGKFNIERDDDGTEYLVGPGIGSERHPAERHSHESSRVSLEEFRTLIKTQAATPNTSVTTVPVSQPSGVSAHSHVHDGSDQDSYREAGLLKDSSERTQRFHPAILLLGAMIGAGMWFLKSRKKRR
jgi:hypothetical protein